MGFGICAKCNGYWCSVGGFVNYCTCKPAEPPQPEPSGDEAKVREILGRLVRATWMEWARKQPAPKASWLVEWEHLSEPDREVDRLIGETLYAVGYGARTEENVLGYGPSSGTPGTGILGRCKDVRDVELIREAYAARKADGARCPNCDHSDVSHGDRGCKRVVLSITTRPQWCPCHLSQTKVLDAIARRGSEGK